MHLFVSLSLRSTGLICRNIVEKYCVAVWIGIIISGEGPVAVVTQVITLPSD
jgi:hypothetical protein